MRAGTGGDNMSKQGNKTRKSGKPGRKPASTATAPRRRGRKPSSRVPSAPRRRRRKLPPGRGAERLRNSVNVILNDESDRIARALVEKTIAGNMTGARLLVELRAKHAPAESEDEWDGPGLIERLSADPPWVDPEPPDPLKIQPGEPRISFEARTLPALPAPKPDL